MSGSSDTMSCPISSTTTAYALRTSDGRVVKFDSASNAKIAQELTNNSKWNKAMQEGAGKTKKMKVRVSGTLQGDTISLDSIKL